MWVSPWKFNAISRHIVLMHTKRYSSMNRVPEHDFLCSVSCVARFFVLHRTKCKPMHFEERVTVAVRVRVRVTSEKRSHSKCIGLHFVLCSTKYEKRSHTKNDIPLTNRGIDMPFFVLAKYILYVYVICNCRCTVYIYIYVYEWDKHWKVFGEFPS